MDYTYAFASMHIISLHFVQISAAIYILWKSSYYIFQMEETDSVETIKEMVQAALSHLEFLMWEEAQKSPWVTDED